MSKVYEIVKSRMIEKLVEAQESGKRFSWVKPWDGGCPWACNYASGKAYRGVNQVLLSAGEYITYNQIRDLQKKDPDIRLKKGSRAHPVFFFKFQDDIPRNDDEADGAAGRRPLVFRYYRAFSIDDVEGIETHWGYEPVEHVLDANAEKALATFGSYAELSGLTVEHVAGSASAYYSPDSHSIRLPDKGQFGSVYDYLSVCFHEAVHSTARALGRKLSGRNGSAAYAAEELVAEIGAAMLCAKHMIADDRTEANSAAYLQHWIGHLSAETGAAIVSAASKAQKACDLICGEPDGKEAADAA